MSILSFTRPDKRRAQTAPRGDIARFLDGASIEVMPRTAEKVADFRTLFAPGTRIYIAHIDGTPIEDMVATAARLRRDGFEPMPHFPARIIPDRATLADWIARYRGEADVSQGLILAGGVSAPRGAYDNSMELLETGLFDAAGFTRLHVAGHPEGNRDIDLDGTDANVSRALAWKQAFSERTDARMAIATQFCFEAAPVIAWGDALRANGIDLPVHIGIAGPAKLQTMLKFAIACGVGPSLRVLQKRALDVTRLVMPYAPDDMLAELAAHKASHPQFAVEAAHIFPLGGIGKAAEWLSTHRNGSAPTQAAGAT
ncbi:methylenetetrahydrofolate reductase [Palleronia sediminis]|uniref:Methylenetetrahydrofolate reductase n=1 Tax=Palleronia sediminis TaxID=2547833 RepID=A0A4R6AP50_9RHOB|nr:methylenetetrahydrofolate reductase [Palleronia sediminis]TDL83756.1 methylenetetrahydrofolate reductase [Palleronia sediminis]